MSNTRAVSSLPDRDQYLPLGLLALLTGALVFTYWNSLMATAAKWSSPQYSHGYMVPLIAGVLLFLRLEPIRGVEASARWAGVALVAGGLLLRLVACYFSLVIPEMVTFLPALAGIFVIVAGWRSVRWAWPAVAFLVFMFPLPDVMERGLLDPLQRLATRSSTFALQTLGLPAFSEGNRILINREGEDLYMGVVDACSGLRMLTIFLAFAAALVMIFERPLWERVVLFLSAIPIALLVNVIRITVTGVLHMFTNEEVANRVFHDFAGWVMMPMAIGFLYVEMQVLGHLVIEDSGDETELVGSGLGSAAS